jgi:lipoate-protein ligase A
MSNAIYLATSHDCAANLAGEAYLMGLPHDHVLYLWENDPCVVVGRFQNPFAECDLAAMDRDHVQLVRRQSGGGAVYQDRGNLCFTFVGKKECSSKEENFAIVLDALRLLGIEGELSGRNDILVEGRKVSGNAFQTTATRFCHHGTMLVDTDLSVMGSYLTPSNTKLASKAVKSIASRVGNLAQFGKDVDNLALRNALVAAFCKVYGPTPVTETDFLSLPETRRNYDLFGDRETILGKTPTFSHSVSHRFPWGEMTVHLQVSDATTTMAKVYSDCLDTALPPALERALAGIPYDRKAFAEAAGKQRDERIGELLRFLAESV